MKKIYLVGLLGLGLLGSCSNEDTLIDARPQKGNYTIEATIGDAQTRTSVDESFGVQWSKGDEIGVYGKTETNVAFTLEGDGGTASGQFTGEFDDKPMYAYYPYSAGASISGNKLEMELPASYSYTGDSNGPMVGKYSEGKVAFKHLCGLLKVDINNIPAIATKFVLEGSSALAGKASVADITADNAVLALSDVGGEVSKTVTVGLSEESTTDKAFYFPLPAGTYESLKVSLQDTDGNVLYEKTASQVVVTRAGAVDMPMLDASIACLKEIAKLGGTYTLISDMIFTEPLVVESTMTLNLNGHTIKPKAGGLVNVLNTLDALVLVRRDAHLTIEDADNTGSIDYNGEESIYAAVKMTDTNDGDGGNGKIAKLTVNGGTLKGYKSGICGNGTRHGTEITIGGGTITASYTEAPGIYHPQDGTLTVTGGEISGATGIEMRSGTLTVTGGTIKGTAGTFSKNANGNGTTIVGAAIAVSQHATNKALKAVIQGGTLEGIYALYEEDLQDTDVSGIFLEVKGGSFKGGIYSENCVNFISSGIFSDPGILKYLAAKANVSVVLDKNCTTPTSLSIGAGTTVSIDLNKKTLTTSETTSSDNISGSLKVSNGNIIGGVKGLCLSADDARLELDGVVYTAPAKSYGIFNNSNVQSSTLIVRNSTIKSGYYAVAANASTNPKVGNTTFTLENSTFTADETALMVNIPATVTVNNCTFTGGWQGVFLRGGTTTFTDCRINLTFTYGYATSSKAQGATWGSGNDAPAAALTVGNRSSSAYDYTKTVTLVNTSFTNSGTDGSNNASDYPAIYIDTENNVKQKVTFTYDDASQTSFNAAGKGLVINESATANVTLNGPGSEQE